MTKKPATKKVHTVTTEVYEQRAVYTDLDAFIAELQAVKTNPDATYIVDVGIYHDYGSDYGLITVIETRPETEEERAAREAKEKQDAKEERATKERQFAKLKKELGK